jgi:hypothetical protein
LRVLEPGRPGRHCRPGSPRHGHAGRLSRYGNPWHLPGSWGLHRGWTSECDCRGIPCPCRRDGAGGFDRRLCGSRYAAETIEVRP